MGTQLKFSTSFYPQTNGQLERTIQILENMLRAYVLDFKDNWMKHLYLVEFSNNNSYQASIGMTLFEALYVKKCCSPLFWSDKGESKIFGLELV